MKEINEAILILADDQARVRYDREYLRFKSFQQEKENTKKIEDPKSKQYEHKKQEQEKKQKKKQKKKPKNTKRKNQKKDIQPTTLTIRF
jgi:hypothetical protein